MKRMMPFLAFLVLAGCSSDKVTIDLTYATTGEPAAKVLVQRRRPVNTWEKVTNPIGATYHGHRLAESHWVENGQCRLDKIGKEDIVDVYTASPDPLIVKSDSRSIKLSPGIERHFSSWVYHLWLENGEGRFTVTEPKWEWQREDPNKADARN
jgi:hypothetical protein